MNKINEISNKYYDFVKEYDYKLEKSNNNSSVKTVEDLTHLCSEWYIEDTINKILLDNKEMSVKQLSMMLEDFDDTLELRNILVNIFDPIDSYIYKIEHLDYITHDIISKEQLKTIVNREFENEKDFKNRDYFNLYLKFIELRDNLSLWLLKLQKEN